jgi:ABC-type branched-subunit amino acid transport system substrate-binding protein
VPACSDKGSPTTPPPTQPNTNTLQLGAVLSLSGVAGSIGQEAKAGAEMAVAQINAYGGILGKQVDLVVVDDKSDPTAAVAAVNEFVPKGVVLGIGPSTSASALALQALISSNQVLYISPSASSSEIDSGGVADGGVAPKEPDTPVLFRTVPSDKLLATALVQFAKGTDANNNQRCKGASIVYEGDDYGQPISDSVHSNLVAFNIGAATPEKIDPNSVNDFNALKDIANAVATKATTGTNPFLCQIVIAQPDLAANYMAAFASVTSSLPGPTIAGANPSWQNFITIGADGFRDVEFINQGKTDKSKPIGPDNKTAGEGAYAIAAITNEDVPANQLPPLKFFLSEFAAAYPELNGDPGRYGTTAYDAMMLLALAIQRTGSATAKDIPNIRSTLFNFAKGTVSVVPNTWSDTLKAVKDPGQDVKYQGASGSLQFQTQLTPGATLNDFGVWKIINGGFARQTLSDGRNFLKGSDLIGGK